MNLDFSEEQLMLRDALRKMLTAECTPKAVRALEDDPTGYSPALWRSLSEMGIAGLTLPENLGGAGQGTIELAIVHEEFGRALCPSPHLPSSVLSAGLIARGGTKAQKRQWLKAIANGEAIVAPAWLEPDSGFGSRGIQLAATPHDDGYRLSGVKFCVPFAAAATCLAVLARTGPRERNIDLLLVDPKAAGVTLTPLLTLASDAQYEVRFDKVTVPKTARVGKKGAGWTLWREAMEEVDIALAAWAVGCGSRAHELATTYAKERVQFGRPIGSFQALAHPLASVAMELEGARALVYQAAWARSAARPSRHLAAMARLAADAANLHATTVTQQVYGGIGFTLDIDVQLYFRRARQNHLAWGTRGDLQDTIAAAVLDEEN